jgi:hypothetical protein
MAQEVSPVASDRRRIPGLAQPTTSLTPTEVDALAERPAPSRSWLEGGAREWEAGGVAADLDGKIKIKIKAARCGVESAV